MGDDAVIELDVGSFTGNSEDETHAAGGWNGKNERCAAGFDDERGGRPRRLTENSDSPGRTATWMPLSRRSGRVAGALTRVEDGHPGGQRNFRGVGAEGFAFEQDGAEDVVVRDAEFQIGALENVGKWRKFEMFSRTIGESEEPIVLVEREE